MAMAAAKLSRSFVSVDEYLESEQKSEVRHEYIDGELYAMAGASQEHNLIAGNLFSALHRHLHGTSCRVFISDIKVRMRIASQEVLYYPDVVVSCDPRDVERYFLQFPKLIVEVLSPGTERIDRREKFLSYQQLDTIRLTRTFVLRPICSMFQFQTYTREYCPNRDLNTAV